MLTLEEYLEVYHKNLKEKEKELSLILIQQFSDDEFFKKNLKTKGWESAKKRAEDEYDRVRNARVEVYFYFDKDEEKHPYFDCEGNGCVMTTEPVHMGKKITTTACKVEELAETETVDGNVPTSIFVEIHPF